jgi:hypothetical protein
MRLGSGGAVAWTLPRKRLEDLEKYLHETWRWLIHGIPFCSYMVPNVFGKKRYFAHWCLATVLMAVAFSIVAPKVSKYVNATYRNIKK